MKVEKLIDYGKFRENILNIAERHNNDTHEALADELASREVYLDEQAPDGFEPDQRGLELMVYGSFIVLHGNINHGDGDGRFGAEEMHEVALLALTCYLKGVSEMQRFYEEKLDTISERYGKRIRAVVEDVGKGESK